MEAWEICLLGALANKNNEEKAQIVRKTFYKIQYLKTRNDLQNKGNEC